MFGPKDATETKPEKQHIDISYNPQTRQCERGDQMVPLITFLPRDFHRAWISPAHARSLSSAIPLRKLGLQISHMVLMRQRQSSCRANVWTSPLMPVWRSPQLKLSPRLLKARIEELVQCGRRDGHVGKSAGKVVKGRQNLTCRRRHRRGGAARAREHALTGAPTWRGPQLHVNKVFIIAKQFGFLDLVQNGPGAVNLTAIKAGNY